VTASHCVCHGPGNGNVVCSEKDEDAGKPLYDPAKHHWVLLGVNNRDYYKLTPNDYPRHVYGVEEVKQNPWFRWENLPNDLAMLKLDRDVEFRNNLIEPICLPLHMDEKDQDIARLSKNKVYSAGWGKTKLFCLTDANGPVKYNKCAMKKITNRFYTPKKCEAKTPPKSTAKLCKKFKKQKPSQYPRKQSESVRIFDAENKKSAYCFAQKMGAKGWCKTFEKGKGGQKWGWCDPTVCNEEPKNSGKLKEVEMSLLTQKDCKYFEKLNDGIMKFGDDIELCSGKKKKFPTQNVYIYYKNRFIHSEKKRLDKIGLKNYKLDYFIGGEDTCSGDSGGPLYTWIDGVPTLIGAVSRGNGRGPTSDLTNGCAELNFPGIYTRINRFLEWIHENSKDGNCY